MTCPYCAKDHSGVCDRDDMQAEIERPKKVLADFEDDDEIWEVSDAGQD